MRAMNEEERKEIEYEITEIMGNAVSSEYSKYFLNRKIALREIPLWKMLSKM